MKKEKKYLIYGIALVLVTLIGVSLSYFVAYIEGDKKQIGVSTTDLKIIFNNGEAISGENIKPGWSITKTFSIENRSDDVFKYNISIEDLVNTFETDGYLQYKITSSNGYNMTEYKDIPKSLEPMDRLLAFNIEIPQGEIQEYTIEMVYRSDDEVNQSADMGKKLSGLLYISEGKEPSLAEHIVSTYMVNNKLYPYYDNGVRGRFKALFYTNLSEDGSYIYYYFGGDEDPENWVKFGKYQTDWYYCIKEDGLTDYHINLPSCPEGYTGTKLASAGDDIYWRIIRTNEDGSVRLLYLGTSPDTQEGNIGISRFNSNYDGDPMYVGYMYGTSGSLANNRTNENSSDIKKVLESWYRYNFYNTEYDKYISKNAIYCNERSVGEGTYSLTTKFDFSSTLKVERLANDIGNTYKCGAYTSYTYGNDDFVEELPSTWTKIGLFETTQAIEDKFSVSIEDGGNGQLNYPIGLITTAEMNFADLMENIRWTIPLWYYTNSNNEYVISNYKFWTMSPSGNQYIYCGRYNYNGSYAAYTFNEFSYVRPVISLDKCALYASGDGTPDNPYTVSAGKCKEYNYPPYNYVDPEPQVFVGRPV